MGRTHKIQRDCPACSGPKRWRVAYQSALKLGCDEQQAREEADLIEAEVNSLLDSELFRDTGVRYGSHRKMRAAANVQVLHLGP